MTFPRRPVYGRGKNRRVPGQMGNWEKLYAEVLEQRRRAGEILEYAYEPERFRLAGRAFYTPDFRVMLADGTIEFHEVKGMWETASRLRIKVAAELHPYRFLAVTRKARKDGGGWAVEDFAGGGDEDDEVSAMTGGA